MFREPLPAARIEIVVTDSLSARGRVDEATIPRIDRDVAYPSALLEEHEVAYSERTCRWLDGQADARHLPRSARQVYAL
jgi:hypothetical protein